MFSLLTISSSSSEKKKTIEL